MKTKEAWLSQAQNVAHRNPWVLGWGALIAVVLTVNLYMIYLAFATSPGLVSQDYYAKGREYEKTVLKRQQLRSALGWELNLDVPPQIRRHKAQTFQLAAVDAYGLPLANAEVKIFAYRPSDASADFSTAMRKEGPGRFRADLTFPLKGIWDVIVHIKNDQGDFDVARRISVGEE